MKRKIRVAIIGVGNCASSLVQGVFYYKNKSAKEGLMNYEIGGYLACDIEFVAAFDIDKNKVGLDLSEAIFQPPNNTEIFAKVPNFKVIVNKGKYIDSLSALTSKKIEISDEDEVNVAETLKISRTDVLINFLPVGSEINTQYYVEECLSAGCSFINAIPVFIASDPIWENKFKKKGLPIIGDDVKSQLGATIINRVLISLFIERGIKIDKLYQINFGGNMDFYNMLDRTRLASKKISKTNAVKSLIPYPIEDKNIHISPSDYIEWLNDKKICQIRIEGTAFGGLPINVDLKLEVIDSPNSAGVVIDAIRTIKIALERNISGALISPSSIYMKSPPKQIPDFQAFQEFYNFLSNSNT